MARKPLDQIAEVAADVAHEPEAPKAPPTKRVRVTHYKIFTSQGRFLAGELAVLPASEADEIVAKGQAKHAEPA